MAEVDDQNKKDIIKKCILCSSSKYIVSLKNSIELFYRGFLFFFLDMKGSPPKMSYLTKLFPLIRKVINRKQFLFSSLLFSHKECLRASSVGTLKQLYSVFQKNCVLRCAQFLSLSIT